MPFDFVAPFDLVIAVDWSAAQGRRPTPGPNRCWVAWAAADGHRSEPVYAPTRLEAEALVRGIIDRHAGARVWVGVDVSIGYPLANDGSAVLPTGRALVAMLAGMTRDDAAGRNNRFEVAGELNRRIAAITGAADGPFWGRPESAASPGLPARRPERTGVRAYREVERRLREGGRARPKSPWQLAGAGSVGGQALTAAPMIHRLITEAGGRLWPWEDLGPGEPGVLVGEIYPSLWTPGARVDAPCSRGAGLPRCRDAQQVIDTAAALIGSGPGVPMAAEARMEGWIAGVAG